MMTRATVGTSETTAPSQEETNVKKLSPEAAVLRQLSPAQRRIMAAVERRNAGEPAVRVARPTREVLLRLGLMEPGEPGQGHYTTELGDAVARLAAAQEQA
jgi:hypothetical protein